MELSILMDAKEYLGAMAKIYKKKKELQKDKGRNFLMFCYSSSRVTITASWCLSYKKKKQ